MSNSDKITVKVTITEQERQFADAERQIQTGGF